MGDILDLQRKGIVGNGVTMKSLESTAGSDVRGKLLGTHGVNNWEQQILPKGEVCR